MIGKTKELKNNFNMNFDNMIKKIKGFFQRVFTEEKFPERTKGKFDKTVGEVYNVKTMKSKEADKMLLALEPKDEYRADIDESKIKSNQS